VLAYLGAVTDEYICKQWEGKDYIQMFTSLFSSIWDQRQMSFVLQ